MRTEHTEPGTGVRDMKKLASNESTPRSNLMTSYLAGYDSVGTSKANAKYRVHSIAFTRLPHCSIFNEFSMAFSDRRATDLLGL